jgi:hypothetical protein
LSPLKNAYHIRMLRSQYFAKIWIIQLLNKLTLLGDGSFKIIVESVDNALDKEELFYVG